MSDLIKQKVKKYGQERRRQLMRGLLGNKLAHGCVDDAVKDAERRYESHLRGLETARKNRAKRHRKTVDMFE